MSSDDSVSQDVALRVTNLSKAYRVYARPIDRLKELLFTRKSAHEVVHALHPISFEVKRGQCMGVIGANGAGKTTLLSLLTGTLSPTTGTIEAAGRISAILGLGIGMLPTYTGRENIRHGLIARGVPFEAHEQKEREIIAFSELHDAIDKPVRTYSSGMGMRLSFAIAHSVEPDILIVDEALSVGDASFVFKCQKKMREFLDRGKTLFFVSHNVNQVKALCSTAMLLQKGKLVAQGDVNHVLRQYQMLYFKEPTKSAAQSADGTQDDGDTLGSGQVELRSLRIRDLLDPVKRVWTLSQGQELIVDVTMDTAQRIESPAIGFLIRTGYGDRVTGYSTVHYGQRLDPVEPGEFSFQIRMPTFLPAGTYKLEIILADVSGDQPVLLRIWEEAALLNIQWASYSIAGAADIGAEIHFRGKDYSMKLERERRAAAESRSSTQVARA